MIGALSALLGLVLVETSRAQTPAPITPSESKIEYTGELSGWLLSQGQTKWKNGVSQLTYKDNSTNIAELTAQATFLKQWFARINGGYGTIGSGNLIDNDYTGPNGALESSTNSNLKGTSVWYINTDAGYKFLVLPDRRGSAGVFTGFQYWWQEYQAIGAVQTVCNPAPVNPLCNPAFNGRDLAAGQSAITNKTQWASWRLGVEGDYRFTRKFAVEGRLAFLPVSYLSNDDIHHLRQTAGPSLPALQQDPSFRMTGWGFGTDVEVGANYMIAPRLFLDLGYRFWWNYVSGGTFTAYPVGAPSSSSNLNSFQSYRYGLTLGLRYAF